MKANEIYDCMFTRPYAEDDDLLNDYVEKMLHHVSWKLWERQEEVVHTIATHNPPLLKGEAAIKVMAEEINSHFAWLRSYMIMRLLMEYRFGNIDFDEEIEWYMRDELGDEDYEEFEKAARKYIYQDYASMLGVEKANEYFKRVGHENYIDPDYKE